MAELALKAAPRGNRSGLSLATDGVQSLVVVVLPKTWRSGPPQTYRLDDAGSATSLAVVHEGDLLVLGNQPGWTRLATELVDRGVDPDQDALLGLATVSGPVTHMATKSLRELDALVGLVRRVGPTTEAVIETASDENASHALAQARLVTEVEAVAGFVRQGYQPAEERLSVVRGRILDRDVLRARARLDTAVLCRFDELTPGTALQRVVVTALERCAEPTTHVDALVLELLGDVATRAQSVRRLLRDVPSLPATEAIRIGRGLPVTRPERRWRAAFEAAVDVLQHAELAAGSEGRPVEVRRLAIRTEALWEEMLERAARMRWPRHAVVRLGKSSDEGAVAVEAPWLATGATDRSDTFPDLLVVGDNDFWCGDAKYKLLTGTASRDDLYQMFAYSHLSRTTSDSRPVTRTALLHPARPGQPPGIAATFLRRPLGDLELDLVALPWPSPEECRSELDPYIRRLAEALPQLDGARGSTDDAVPTLREPVPLGWR